MTSKYTKSHINRMIDDKKTNNNWSYVYLSFDLNTEIQGNKETILNYNNQNIHLIVESINLNLVHLSVII
jgi:hypothetical protein